MVESPILAENIVDVRQKKTFKDSQSFFPENSIIIAPNTIEKIKVMEFISLSPNYYLGMKKIMLRSPNLIKSLSF